jgi:hypothetical protein
MLGTCRLRAHQASRRFRPAILDNISETLGDFFEGTFARWSHGGLSLRQQGLSLYGREVLARGTATVTFKPKKGC